MNYNCKKCNKNFTSRMGIYKHNKKVHTNDEIIKEPTINNICQYCNKELYNYLSKWRHEKICKLNETNYDSTIRKEIRKEVQHEINLLKRTLTKNQNNTPIITNNTTNNTNNNNTQNIIYVFPFGKEPNNVLSADVIVKTIEAHGINSVMELVKKKHFNPELPECHNFFVSARNDNYAGILDSETKRVKYVNKKDVFDNVYTGIVNNINSVVKPTEDKVKQKTQPLEETLDKINNIPVSKKMLKKLHCGINEEAYHNRDLIQKTLETAHVDDDERIIIDLNDVSSDSESEEEYNHNQDLINQTRELLNKVINYRSLINI